MYYLENLICINIKIMMGNDIANSHNVFPRDRRISWQYFSVCYSVKSF